MYNPRRIVVASVPCLVLLVVALRTRPAWAGASFGPDVAVLELIEVQNHGALGGVRAYSLGTTACNVGTQPLDWCNEIGGCGEGTTAADHPVIAQNLYRLKAGRFEQIGMSWLKHGFLSTNSTEGDCGDCAVPPLGSDQLGVGCTDTYGAGLNGRRPLGMRSEVAAATGSFPYPFTAVAATSVLEQRIRVAETDLDPAENPGALYWMEGQYVAGDDAAGGNSFNNASHRAVAVGAAPGFDLAPTGPTVVGSPALFAWQSVDPEVEIVAVDVPGSSPVERFHVGRRVTDLGGGSWHYEYAVHNLNSDRAGRIFAIRFPPPTTIGGVGFHAIGHHSGEPYATTAWTASTALEDIVVWFTGAFAADPNANALRWGTTYSFWFDASSPPTDGIQHLLFFFRPGEPNSVLFGF
jgi:hypothetical protein